jgi:hypothetical protein
MIKAHQDEVVLFGRRIVQGIIKIKLKLCIRFLREGKRREVLCGARIIHG